MPDSLLRRAAQPEKAPPPPPLLPPAEAAAAAALDFDAAASLSSPSPTVYETLLAEQAGGACADLGGKFSLIQQSRRLSLSSRFQSASKSGLSASVPTAMAADGPSPGSAVGVASPSPLFLPNGWFAGATGPGKTCAVTSHAATPEPAVDKSNTLAEEGERPDYLQMILSAKVYDVADVTPLQVAPGLSAKLGRDNHVLLKREDLQPVFSFKCRGAYNRMAHLSDEEKRRGVIACSAGNHAQGVALAAQRMGVRAVIVMPMGTPAIKFRNVARLGGEVVLFGDDFDAAKKECARMAKQYGYVNIPPFDDPYVIAGCGTVGLEILRQTDLEKITAIFCAVGGGGLISGIAAYVKRVRPAIRVFGVETNDSACMTEALQAGERVELAQVGLFADGAAVKLAGEEPFRICKENVDGMVNVTNDELCAAMKDIFEDTRTVVEPAGALGVAGCKKYVEANKDLAGGVYVCVLSGANINFDRLRFVAERAEIGEKREVLISVIIPERPRSFSELYSVIYPRNVTEFSYRYADPELAHVYMSFIVLDPARRLAEVAEIFEALKKKGMEATDLSDNELAKSHARYMIGGRSRPENEKVLRFVFPERPGALKQFLDGVQTGWNISMWHYRNYGSDMAKVLVGIQVPGEDEAEFAGFLKRLQYPYTDESNNPVYAEFLRS